MKRAAKNRPKKKKLNCEFFGIKRYIMKRKHFHFEEMGKKRKKETRIHLKTCEKKEVLFVKYIARKKTKLSPIALHRISRVLVVEFYDVELLEKEIYSAFNF